ncbi:hypothetical protein OAM69_05770 [bacterium]|nr:hypothetical protein [bacterium]
MEDCVLCNETVESLEEQIDAVVMDMIRKDHPDWVETDGSCKKCTSYFANLDQMVEVDK